MEDKKYTREDIEALKKKDPSELTGREKGLANLKPAKKGEIRNPKGRGKGVKNWSTYFKNLLNDEQFLSTIIKSLPDTWNDTVEKYPASVIAAGLITTATQSVAKSVAEGKPVDEQTLRTLDRIQRFTYGDKITHDVDEDSGFFEKAVFNFNVVKPEKREEGKEN